MGTFFSPVCLAMEGLHGILATIFEHQAAALSAISTIGTDAHPKKLELLLASQALWLEPSWHWEHQTMWHMLPCWKQHLPARSTAYYAITSVAFRILIWIVELVFFATPPVTVPRYFLTHAFWHHFETLPPPFVVIALLAISLKIFILGEIKSVQPAWTL